MSQQPSKFTVLGTLVDRAVSMPYAKPHVLHKGHRNEWDKVARKWQRVTSVQEDVREAADFITRILESRNANREWSKAEIAIDPAGPWWSKTRDDYLGLDDRSMEWVLDRFGQTAGLAAKDIEAKAVDQEWTWPWSQPSFATPGRNRPSITRPELIAGLCPTQCELADLKRPAKPTLALS